MNIVKGDTATIKSEKAGFDITTWIGSTRATLSFSGKVVGGCDDVATEFKLDNSTVGKLYNVDLGTGIRARINRTGEWVLLTDQNGQDFTITRAQDDPSASPTVAAEIRSGDRIDIVPTDSVPASATVDPEDSSAETALVELDSTMTNIPEGSYECQIVLSDGSRVKSLSAVEKLTISTDPNAFGV